MLQRAQGRLALLPSAPISARIDAQLPRLRSLAALAGPSVLLDGALNAELAIDGTLADPRVSGSVVGNNLAVNLFDYGLRLADGMLRARLENDMLILDQAVFEGAEGRLTASGRVALDAAVDAPGIELVAEQLQVLSGPTGTMVVSGLASAFTRAGQFQVDGRLVVDRARFRLPDQRAPSLGADVVIVRDGQLQDRGGLPWTTPAGRFAPLFELSLDLGDDFRFVGSGADLLLAGELDISAGPYSALRVAGTIDVLEGSYEAFGAELTIEQGSITFRGTPTNPQVNILAMRRGQEVDAGVRVTGTIERPRVRVVSEPEVPEAEKLSWLVFGRGEGGAPGQGGAGAAQAAGIGLLNRFGASRLASTVGLSDLSIGTSAFAADGEQVVNIGKEISDRLYVAYEQSLAGTGSILTLTYEISRVWSIVLHGGTVSGIEVRYDGRFDKLRSR
jgi:translocation and assembly module TamB